MEYINLVVFVNFIFGSTYEADKALDEYIDQWTFLFDNSNGNVNELNNNLNDAKPLDETTSAELIEFLNQSEQSKEALTNFFQENEKMKEDDNFICQLLDNVTNTSNSLNSSSVNTKDSLNESFNTSLPSPVEIKDINEMNKNSSEFTLKDFINETIENQINKPETIEKLGKRKAQNISKKTQAKNKKKETKLSMVSDPDKLIDEYENTALKDLIRKIHDFSSHEKEFLNFLYDIFPRDNIDWRMVRFEDKIKMMCREACLNIMSLIKVEDSNLGWLMVDKKTTKSYKITDIDEINYKMFLIIQDRLKIKQAKKEVMRLKATQRLLSWINEEIIKNKLDKSGFPFQIINTSIKLFSDLTKNQMILIVLKRAEDLKDWIEEIPEIKGLIIYILQSGDIKSLTVISYLLFLFSYIEVNGEFNYVDKKIIKKPECLRQIISNIIMGVFFKKNTTPFYNGLITLMTLENIIQMKGKSFHRMFSSFKGYFFLMIFLENDLNGYYRTRHAQNDIKEKALSLYTTIHTFESLFNFLVLN